MLMWVCMNVFAYVCVHLHVAPGCVTRRFWSWFYQANGEELFSCCEPEGSKRLTSCTGHLICSSSSNQVTPGAQGRWKG